MIEFTCDGCGKTEPETIREPARNMKDFLGFIPVATPDGWYHVISPDEVRWLACCDACISSLSTMYLVRYGKTPTKDEDEMPAPTPAPPPDPSTLN